MILRYIHLTEYCIKRANDSILSIYEKSKVCKNEDIHNAQAYSILRIYGILIYKSLQFSVISGEYINDAKFEEKLTQCKSDIRKILTNVHDEAYAAIEKSFCNIIINSLDNYRDIVHKYRIHINNPDKIFLISEFGSESIDTATNMDFIDLVSDSLMLNYSLVLARIDMTLTLDPQYLRDLLFLLKRLEDSRDNKQKFCLYLIDKCKLLVLKFRLQHRNNDIFSSLVISYNFSDEEFNPDSIKLEFLSVFGDLVKNAYPDTNNNKSFLLKYVKDQKYKAQTILDYFLFVQYYRKESKSVEDIEKLIKEFKDRFSGEDLNKEDFDKRSYFTCLNFLYNNRLSLWCCNLISNAKNDYEKDYEKINNELANIKKLQRTTDTKNYHPYMVLAGCYSNYIDFLYKKDIGNTKIDIIDKYLEKFQECIMTTKEYLKWSDRACFFPFQPIYSECLISHKNTSIFIYSSYILPIDYDKEEGCLTDLRSKYEQYKMTLGVHKSLVNDRIKMEKVQQEAQNSQRNNIQILAIFATLVVFSMGSIQMFKNFPSSTDAIKFMLAFGFALCLFAISIWFVINTNKICRGFIYVILFICFMLSIHYYCK